MAVTKTVPEQITLGSGLLYYMEYNGSVPDDATIETKNNILGYIEGGATLEYKPTFTTVSDDLDYVSRTVTTKEETTLKSGLITYNADTLKVLCSTAREVSNSVGGKRTIKIGGLQNDNGKDYLFRFVHKDNVAGDVRITVAGRNQAGFSLAYQQDKATTVDAEIKASRSLDDTGTKIIYEETAPTTASE